MNWRAGAPAKWPVTSNGGRAESPSSDASRYTRARTPSTDASVCS